MLQVPLLGLCRSDQCSNTSLLAERGREKLEVSVVGETTPRTLSAITYMYMRSNLLARIHSSLQFTRCNYSQVPVQRLSTFVASILLFAYGYLIIVRSNQISLSQHSRYILRTSKVQISMGRAALHRLLSGHGELDFVVERVIVRIGGHYTAV